MYTVDPTADGRGAGGAFLGEQVAEAVEAVGEVVAGGEALAGQLHFAADADETVLVPRLVPVAHTASGDGLKRERHKKKNCYYCFGGVCFVFCFFFRRSRLEGRTEDKHRDQLRRA